MSPSLLPNFLGTGDDASATKIYKLSQHRAYTVPEIIRVYDVKEDLIKKGEVHENLFEGRKIMIGKEARIVYIQRQVRIVSIQNEIRSISA